MSPTSLPAEVDQRLTDLEIKLSYTEDLLEQLNLTVYRQQETITALTEAVRTLKAQGTSGDAAGQARDPRAEIPPHY